MIKRRLRNQTQLLVEDEHQRGHHRQPILSSDLVDLLHRLPRDFFIAVFFPSLEVTGMKILLLVVDRSLRQHGHPKRHRLQNSLVVAHLDVVSAQNERLDTAHILLLTGGDSIQVQIDQIRRKLQGEAFQFVLVGSVEVVELNANRMKKLQSGKCYNQL